MNFVEGQLVYLVAYPTHSVGCKIILKKESDDGFVEVLSGMPVVFVCMDKPEKYPTSVTSSLLPIGPRITSIQSDREYAKILTSNGYSRVWINHLVKNL